MLSTAPDCTQRRQKIRHRLEDPQAQCEQAERQDLRDVSVGDGAVDDRLGDQGDRDRQTHVEQRRRRHHGQRQEVRTEVAPQPPQRVDARRRVLRAHGPSSPRLGRHGVGGTLRRWLLQRSGTERWPVARGGWDGGKYQIIWWSRHDPTGFPHPRLRPTITRCTPRWLRSLVSSRARRLETATALGRVPAQGHPVSRPSPSGSGASTTVGVPQAVLENLAATWSRTSFPAGSPMLTRQPSPAKGRTMTPTSSAAAAKSAVRSPSASQTKLPCASGTRQPCSRERGDDPLPLLDDPVDPLEQGGLLAQRGDRGGLRDRGDPERQCAGPDRGGDLGRGDDVADAEAGQPVGLGEGAHGHDVGA